MDNYVCTTEIPCPNFLKSHIQERKKRKEGKITSCMEHFFVQCGVCDFTAIEKLWYGTLFTDAHQWLG